MTCQLRGALANSWFQSMAARRRMLLQSLQTSRPRIRTLCFQEAPALRRTCAVAVSANFNVAFATDLDPFLSTAGAAALPELPNSMEALGALPAPPAARSARRRKKDWSRAPPTDGFTDYAPLSRPDASRSAAPASAAAGGAPQASTRWNTALSQGPASSPRLRMSGESAPSKCR